MKRNIISIDQDKCNGCGICVSACHEGAIQMVDGKAQLVTESYCDGLGDCLPECPTGAITMENREAPSYDETAVKANSAKAAQNANENEECGCNDADSECDDLECECGDSSDECKEPELPCGCPGTHSRVLNKQVITAPVYKQNDTISELRQWPVQIKLVPVNAPYFDNAKLLIAADCTAFANANIHRDYMSGKITLIGCPKLDNEDYSKKLGEIIKNNNIKSISVLRMSVPCCGGIVYAVQKAILSSGKMIPWDITVLSPDGNVIEE